MFRERKRTADDDQDQDTRVACTPDDDAAFTAHLLPSTRAHLPEISLVAALFDDAVRCVQRTSRGVTHRQTSEALEWIASDRRDWPFAFTNVCDLLGVDAKAVRERLLDEGSGNVR